jgi:hypothetical protein
MKNPTTKIITIKSIIAVIIFSVATYGAYYIYNLQASKNPQLPETPGYKNTTYIIEGSQVTLVNGVSTTPIENSSASVVTTFFGNELFNDLNDDGRDDVVFLLTQQTGGSGTFYYVVAALNTESGYVGSQALFLGDRIAPQTTESGPGKQIIVNYAERGLNEPMTNQPSMAKSITLILDVPSMIFGEVAVDFEGESSVKDAGRWTYSEVSAQGAQFMYPKVLETKYITASEWPPKLEMQAGDFVCTMSLGGRSESPMGKVQKITIEGREYCVITVAEGAAGSTYTTYQYTTKQGDFLPRLTFTLRTPQCMNYDEPSQSACKFEQSTYSVNGLADKMMSSIRMR